MNTILRHVTLLITARTLLTRTRLPVSSLTPTQRVTRGGARASYVFSETTFDTTPPVAGCITHHTARACDTPETQTPETRHAFWTWGLGTWGSPDLRGGDSFNNFI